MVSVTFTFVVFVVTTIVIIAFSTEFIVPRLAVSDVHKYSYNYPTSTYNPGKAKPGKISKPSFSFEEN